MTRWATFKYLPICCSSLNLKAFIVLRNFYICISIMWIQIITSGVRIGAEEGVKTIQI